METKTKGDAVYQRFKPKDSWTHVFVCLSERDDSYVPQRDEKRALKEAIRHLISVGKKTNKLMQAKFVEFYKCSKLMKF